MYMELARRNRFGFFPPKDVITSCLTWATLIDWLVRPDRPGECRPPSSLKKSRGWGMNQAFATKPKAAPKLFLELSHLLTAPSRSRSAVTCLYFCTTTHIFAEHPAFAHPHQLHRVLLPAQVLPRDCFLKLSIATSTRNNALISLVLDPLHIFVAPRPAWFGQRNTSNFDHVALFATVHIHTYDD